MNENFIEKLKSINSDEELRDIIKEKGDAYALFRIKRKRSNQHQRVQEIGTYQRY